METTIKETEYHLLSDVISCHRNEMAMKFDRYSQCLEAKI